MNDIVLRYRAFAVFVVLLIAVPFCIWAGAALAQRISVERANDHVEVCVDWYDASDLCERADIPLSSFLGDCRAEGAVSVALFEETPATLRDAGRLSFAAGDPEPGSASTRRRAAVLRTGDPALARRLSEQMGTRYGLSVDTVRRGPVYEILCFSSAQFGSSVFSEDMPLGFSDEKNRFVREQGMDAVCRPQNKGMPAWLSPGLPAEAKTLLFDSRELPGYPSRMSELITAIRSLGLTYVSVEFTDPSGMAALNRDAGDRLVRGHTILSEELERNDVSAFWVRRWERAVAERGIRFLYFRFRTDVSPAYNLAYLRDTVSAITSRGFVTGRAVPPSYPGGAPLNLRLAGVLAAAVFFPLLALFLARRAGHPVAAFALCNAVTLAGGLCVAALVFDRAFMLKIAAVPAVKTMFVAPLAAAVFLLYPWQRLKEIWVMPVQVRHVVLALSALCMLLIILIRSGNSVSAWMLPDMPLRHFMESLFSVRPRTKEFLFAQPLLFLGFQRRQPLLILIGMIGQVSIINTFLHAHSFMAVSVVRSLHGMWLGLAIGLVLAAAAGAIHRKAAA